MSFWMANSLKGSTCGCCMSTMASLWWPWAAMKRRWDHHSCRMEQLLVFTPSSDPRVIFVATFHITRIEEVENYESNSGVVEKTRPPACEAIEPLEKGLSRCRYCKSIGWIFRCSLCCALDVWLLELLEPTCQAWLKCQECSSATRPECLRFDAESTLAMRWSAPTSWLEESRAQAMPMQAWTNCNRHKMSLPEASLRGFVGFDVDQGTCT